MLDSSRSHCPANNMLYGTPPHISNLGMFSIKNIFLRIFSEAYTNSSISLSVYNEQSSVVSAYLLYGRYCFPITNISLCKPIGTLDPIILPEQDQNHVGRYGKQLLLSSAFACYGYLQQRNPNVHLNVDVVSLFRSLRTTSLGYLCNLTEIATST